MLSGNKGEWSEIYALFKLLGEGRLFTGDADLKKIEDIFYPIIRVLRNESGGNYEYELNGNLVIISGGKVALKLPAKLFSEQAANLLMMIKTSSGAFYLPETEAFMNSINCYSLKAKSSSKTDIRIVIHDQRVNQTVELGFSIKSQLGGDATLLNAGRTTNFIYKVEGIYPNLDEISLINNIETRSKIKDRIEKIVQLGGSFKFSTLENGLFKNNLILIDSFLPSILSSLVYLFYTSSFNSIKDLTTNLNTSNPLEYDMQHSHSFYEYKVKRFLTDIALGMAPSRRWDGIYDATGGYLIVKENGDVLCYHIYNRNQFENYLFANTKLETASSTRHGFGVLYKQNDNFYFKLNLQIRFK